MTKHYELMICVDGSADIFVDNVKQESASEFNDFHPDEFIYIYITARDGDGLMENVTEAISRVSFEWHEGKEYGAANILSSLDSLHGYIQCLIDFDIPDEIDIAFGGLGHVTLKQIKTSNKYAMSL